MGMLRFVCSMKIRLALITAFCVATGTACAPRIASTEP